MIIIIQKRNIFLFDIWKILENKYLYVDANTCVLLLFEFLNSGLLFVTEYFYTLLLLLFKNKSTIKM